MREQLAIVKCRPGLLIWSLVVFFIGISIVVAMQYGQPDEHGEVRGIGESVSGFLVVFVPGVCCAAYALRASIVAAETGLRWRDLGRWKEVSWDQVSDFYDERKDGARFTVGMIETPVGKIMANRYAWTNIGALRAMTEKYALRAPNPKWAERGHLSPRSPSRFSAAPGVAKAHPRCGLGRCAGADRRAGMQHAARGRFARSGSAGSGGSVR